jgi:hypothetical protein
VTLNQRPTGITILAVLAIIAGGLLILGGLAAVAGGAILGAVTGSGFLAGYIGLIGIAILALGAVYIAAAYGLWNLRPWAWQLTLIAASLSIALQVLQFAGGIGDVTSVVLSVGINGVVIYYLLQPEVKAAFGRV